MTGLETLVIIGKILVPLIVLGLSTSIKFLWDIKINSKQVQEEFHNFKIQFTSEISSIKNKIDVLDQSFWNNPLVIRYGINENLYGFEEIAVFRATRPSKGLLRNLSKTVITTFGHDLAKI
jgi:hypothetical protein